MSRRTGIALALVIVVALVLVVRKLIDRQPVDDSAFLLGLVDHLAAAAEKRDLKELRRWIGRDYRDDEGRDYQTINAMLTMQLLRQGVVSVYPIGKVVALDGESATVKVKLVLTRAPRSKRLIDIVPESARALQLELDLAKREDWRVVRARWRDLNLREVLGETPVPSPGRRA